MTLVMSILFFHSRLTPNYRLHQMVNFADLCAFLNSKSLNRDSRVMTPEIWLPNHESQIMTPKFWVPNHNFWNMTPESWLPKYDSRNMTPEIWLPIYDFAHLWSSIYFMVSTEVQHQWIVINATFLNWSYHVLNKKQINATKIKMYKQLLWDWKASRGSY